MGLPGNMPRKINVTMIGAGSFFTNSILKDVVLIPGTLGGELRLIDIDGERLTLAHRIMQRIIEEAKHQARLEAEKTVLAAKAEIELETTRAREALRERVADLAVAGAEKILLREVDAKAHAVMLAELKKDL